LDLNKKIYTKFLRGSNPLRPMKSKTLITSFYLLSHKKRQMKKTSIQKQGMKKSHKVGITIFLIVKVLLIISVIYLALSLITIQNELQQQINQTEQNLNDKINNLEETIKLNQKITQSQVTEIRNSLAATTESLENQFAELKADVDSDFSGIIQQEIPSVVSIGTDISQGSGFIIQEQGYVVTNAHVLSGSSFTKVLTYDSSSWKDADIIGYNGEMDIAVLKISGTYDALEFGDSDNVQIGEKTIAIGNPLGLSFSVTEGIVSQINRQGPNGQPIYIQIDTPLNSGNSGGPLINKQGQVIGINNFKVKGGENLGFALESNTAVETINDILYQASESIRI